MNILDYQIFSFLIFFCLDLRQNLGETDLQINLTVYRGWPFRIPCSVIAESFYQAHYVHYDAQSFYYETYDEMISVSECEFKVRNFFLSRCIVLNRVLAPNLIGDGKLCSLRSL